MLSYTIVYELFSVQAQAYSHSFQTDAQTSLRRRNPVEMTKKVMPARVDWGNPQADFFALSD